MLKGFPYRSLPGGRKVRDYAGVTAVKAIEAVKESDVQAEAVRAAELERPKPRKTVLAALEKTGEDE